MSMEIAKERYIKWHETHYPGTNKEYQRHAVDQLENSKIQTYIKKSRRGNFLKGYKILDLNEEAADDETYYTDIHEKDEQNANDIKTESAIDLLNRLCADYVPSTKPILENFTPKKNQVDDDSDSDIDDIVETTKTREPTKNLKCFDTFSNSSNTASNLDSNGIKIANTKNTKKHNGHMEFIIDNSSSDESD